MLIGACSEEEDRREVIICRHLLRFRHFGLSSFAPSYFSNSQLRSCSKKETDKGSGIFLQTRSSATTKTSQGMELPYSPPTLHPGNMVQGADGGQLCGLIHLYPADVRIERLSDEEAASSSSSSSSSIADEGADATSVIWEDVVRVKRQKRRNADSPVLELVALNRSISPAFVTLSLLSSVSPTFLSGLPLPLGSLTRSRLPSDATPALPASLGRTVRFCTVSADVPPRSKVALLCTACRDADKVPGFACLAGKADHHPNPLCWDPRNRITFPLVGALESASFLCTQGFGSRGHHRGPSMHHAADFSCDAGTVVVAAFDGTVVKVDVSHSVGGAHVDLLPEANELLLRREEDGVVAVYLHLMTDSAKVREGDKVKAGQPLALSGDTGFSTGPHLHFQLNSCLSSSGDEETVMWAICGRDDHQRPTLPVAGNYYGPGGWAAPKEELDALRAEIWGTAPPSSSLDVDEVPLLESVRNALLWLYPGPFPPTPTPGGATLSENHDPHYADDPELRPYPSLHTCLVANVVAAASVLREGSASRFARAPGAIPPVYLACQFNFERDDVTGEMFSAEPASRDEQERAEEERNMHEEVAFAQPRPHGSDWRAFFLAEFELQQMYEVWRGSTFINNIPYIPRRPQKGLEVCGPVYTLCRSSLDSFEADVAADGSRAGVVAVFRTSPPSTEPFGIWLLWLRLRGKLLLVDLQNSTITESLRSGAEALKWEEVPREECFWAPFRGSKGRTAL